MLLLLLKTILKVYKYLSFNCGKCIETSITDTVKQIN
jgi:hypothetical protein